MVAMKFLGSLAAFAATVAARAEGPVASNEEGLKLLAQELMALNHNPNASVDAIEEIEKRQGGYIPITGIPDNQIRVRYPIQTLHDQFPDQFALFVLGLQDFQNMNQADPLSYYQVTGIHGVPNVCWNKVCGPAYNIGYCEHSSILFPTWHRAFMGLFEQQWKVSVNRVVQQFPAGARRQRYANAAATIRFPYLDWANKPGNYFHVIPDLVSQNSITIDTPNGVQTIYNPLFRYGFHPLNPNDMIYEPWRSWQVTFRYPTSQDPSQAVNTVSQNNLMVGAFDSPNVYNGLRQNVYNMFTLCTEFTEFSNDHAGSSTPNCHTSLESIHDGVHNLAGGPNKGHMTYLWWSHFDPFFWLHHMNVERLFAIWQAVNKQSYYDYSWKEPGSNYMRQTGAITDINSPLYPFTMDAAGNFWRPNNIYNHRVFHSTFPEFVNWDGNSATMRGIVNRLYGNAQAGAKKAKNKRSILSGVGGIIGGAVNGHINDVVGPNAGNAIHQATSQVASQVSSATSQASDAVSSATSDLAPAVGALASDIGQAVTNAVQGTMASLASLTTPQGRRYEYIVNVLLPRFALDDSYNVYCFLGQPTTNNTSQYMTDDNMVGFVAAFAMPGMKGMMEDDTISGAVPLTNALVNLVGAKKIKSMNPSDVTPFLKKNLIWKVVTVDGKVFNNADVPNLKVSVVHSDVTPAKSQNDFPTWGAFNTISEITQGKAGGLVSDIVGGLTGAGNVGHAIDQTYKQGSSSTGKACKRKVKKAL